MLDAESFPLDDTVADAALPTRWAPAFAAKAPATRAALAHYRPYVAQVRRDISPQDKEEFTRIVQRAPKSAPGLDGIRHSHLACAGPGAMDIPYECYLSIVAASAPPPSFNAALLILIPKGVGDGRGRCVLCCSARLAAAA